LFIGILCSQILRPLPSLGNWAGLYRGVWYRNQKDTNDSAPESILWYFSGLSDLEKLGLGYYSYRSDPELTTEMFNG
jgi:hypothetical protein